MTINLHWACVCLQSQQSFFGFFFFILTTCTDKESLPSPLTYSAGLLCFVHQQLLPDTVPLKGFGKKIAVRPLTSDSRFWFCRVPDDAQYPIT